jgi:acyl carrier protein
MTVVERQKVTQFIKTAIVDSLSRPELFEDISEKTPLEEMGIDSVAAIHLVVQFELEYGIFYEDEELLIENFQTVGIIADRIMDKLSASPST